MPTDRVAGRGLRAALLGGAAGLLLVGCGNAAPTPGGDPSSAAASPGAPTAPADQTDSPSGGDASANTDAQSDAQSDSQSDDESVPGPELPEVPEQEATSLAELLTGVTTAPLATAPLPRAASAGGRLVGGFPSFLRPARSSRVDTSSVSTSESNLQVALVGSTSLPPGDVLLAYRTRLAGRGLAEQAPPAVPAGSDAAEFRRGRSTVTVTVTPQGSRTRYSVLAFLHAGGE